MTNPYKVVQIGVNKDGKKIFGVQYKNYPSVGFPDSWGTRLHALKYMAALLGLTYAEYQNCKGKLK